MFAINHCCCWKGRRQRGVLLRVLLLLLEERRWTGWRFALTIAAVGRGDVGRAFRFEYCCCCWKRDVGRATIAPGVQAICIEYCYWRRAFALSIARTGNSRSFEVRQICSKSKSIQCSTVHVQVQVLIISNFSNLYVLLRVGGIFAVRCEQIGTGVVFK